MDRLNAIMTRPRIHCSLPNLIFGRSRVNPCIHVSSVSTCYRSACDDSQNTLHVELSYRGFDDLETTVQPYSTFTDSTPYTYSLYSWSYPLYYSEIPSGRALTVAYINTYTTDNIPLSSRSAGLFSLTIAPFTTTVVSQSATTTITSTVVSTATQTSTSTSTVNVPQSTTSSACNGGMSAFC